jgi:Ca2+/Na+ antiporter
MMKHQILPVSAIVIVIIIFFHPFFFTGKLPIPADTIIGLYHPYRDLYAPEYPNGIPFKNFLITDPVRQQYPWRALSVEAFQSQNIPLWNPYSFSGYPLLANMQSAAFSPINILFFLMPFPLAWSMGIVLQPLLAGVFMYIYLRNLKVSVYGAFLGAVTYSFSGFFVSWMTWGTVLHVALWLPLLLFSIDKLSTVQAIRKRILFMLLTVIILVFALYAGHLQTYFYMVLLAGFYWLFRAMQISFHKLFIKNSFIVIVVALALSFPFLYTVFQFISLSARDVDVLSWKDRGWFLPIEHLTQFIAPDFFGNPTTLNYWGTWNYGELVGYVGIVSLLCALTAGIFLRKKEVLFFSAAFVCALLFATDTGISRLPFLLHIPLLSTAQPTRLLFLADFSLAVLASFGIDYLVKEPKKGMLIVSVFGVSVLTLWVFVFSGFTITNISVEHIAVAKRNLIFPTGIFIVAVCLLIGLFITKRKGVGYVFVLCLIVLQLLDLYRFHEKFTPFVSERYLFPETTTTAFLSEHIGNHRVMSIDDRILPPNFSSTYKIQSISGYDPLYLRRYGELLAASERGKPDITPPFGFNRIITPKRYSSEIINLLGVKYILSFNDISSESFQLVHAEGQTKIYENTAVFPRVFFVRNIYTAEKKEDVIQKMFDPSINLRNTAVIEVSKHLTVQSHYILGRAEIVEYNNQAVVVKTSSDGDGFLVITDSYYPTWKAELDGRAELDIYRTDYNFRGVFVPKGEHLIRFHMQIL